MTLQELQQRLFARVGFQLIVFQHAESLLRVCTQLVLPPEQVSTVEQLYGLEEQERKKTLGYFLTTVRKRVAIQPTFDAALAIFLDDRNKFVHDISKFPQWNPRTVEGCKSSEELLKIINRRTQVVIDVFTGLVRAWELQNGNPTTIPGREAEFARIESELVPLANHFFAPKGDA